MLRDLIENAEQYFVSQKKEWTEILVDFETRNQYKVLDVDKKEVGTISEVSSGIGGFLKRNFFGSHRSLDVRVHDADGSPVLRLERPFFFWFSSLEVKTEGGAGLGRVERRFGLIYKKYDLVDANGRTFAGEIFADADTFRVAIEEGNWSGPERWVLFAAAISIDFDFFENNQGSGGLFSFFD